MVPMHLLEVGDVRGPIDGESERGVLFGRLDSWEGVKRWVGLT